MKRSAKALFAAVLAALSSVLPAAAQQPGFPQTMPPNTVYGRSGISAGPGQAIPFSQLFQAGIEPTFISMNVTPGGCSEPLGAISPFYLCNNAAGLGANQKSNGLAIIIGPSIAATPADSDSIAFWTYIDNTAGRLAIWAYNPICFQAPASGGGGFGINHCVEIDVNQAFVSSTPNQAFGGGAVSHGIELVSSINTSGALFPPQTAITIDSANDVSASVEWFNFGIGVRRAHFGGLSCEYVVGDTTPAFTHGCLVDQSQSTNVVLDTGTHTSIINLAGSTFTNFVLGASGGATNLPFHNHANFGLTIQFGAGLNAAENVSLQFVDQSSGKWTFLKDTSNNFHLTNNALSTDAFNILVASNLVTFTGSGAGGLQVQPSGFFMPATANGGVSIFTTANASAFSFTLTFPAATGTFAVSAASPLSLNATTGALSVVGVTTVCTVTAGNSLTFTNGVLTTKGANCT